MPNWEQIVAERLERLKLAPEERREVVAEIAAHLAECYQEMCDAGSPDPEGYTLAQVRDWKALRRRIQKAKEGRMSFARKVVMPGLAALFLAQVALAVILRSFVTLYVPALPGGFYLPWLLTLPWAGAVGAWLARRAGARPAHRLTAALFPALFAIVVSTLFGLIALLASPQKLISEWRLDNQAAVFLFWVIMPAIGCGLGAIPFLYRRGQCSPVPPSDLARA